MPAAIESPRMSEPKRMSVRDWLDPMCREWGAQKRRIMAGRLVRKDGTVHEDGWPSTSVAAAIADGRITGGSGHAQHFPEVYQGDALVIWRAFQQAPSEVREMLHMHYVVKLDADEEPESHRKARIMGWSKATYFHKLQIAQYYLAGVIVSQPSDAA